MAVDVKKVANRRKIRYDTLQGFLQDAEQLGKGEVQTLGNWNYAQILHHLAFAMNGSIDGSPLQFPWPIRTVARLLRKRILNGSMSPGFNLSRKNNEKAWSQSNLELPSALDGVREAVGRLQRESKRSKHPAFGELTPEEWDTFHLRHAELHMSFVVPA